MVEARRGFFASVNWLIFRSFLTLWAVCFYFSFFQNYVYLTLVAAAVVGDFARWRQVVFDNTARNVAIGVLIAFYTLHLFLVLQLGLGEAAYYVPWSHSLVGLQRSDAPFASWVYCVESAGITIGLYLLALFALHPRGETGTLKTEPQLELRKLFFFFVILYGVTLLTLYFGVGRAAVVAHSFRPESNLFHLVAYAVIPSFFAFGMKYWLAEVQQLLGGAALVGTRAHVASCFVRLFTVFIGVNAVMDQTLGIGSSF